MKRLIVVLFAFLYVSPAYAVNCDTNPTHPQCTGGGGSAAGPYGFAGYSSGTVAGDVGFPPLHAACQADFGNLARMCKSVEAALSPNFSASATPAWVQPVNAGNGDDMVGVTIGAGNCRGWRVASFALVTVNGTFSTHDCTVPTSVTCCTPIQ